MVEVGDFLTVDQLRQFLSTDFVRFFLPPFLDEIH